MCQEGLGSRTLQLFVCSVGQVSCDVSAAGSNLFFVLVNAIFCTFVKFCCTAFILSRVALLRDGRGNAGDNRGDGSALHF